MNSKWDIIPVWLAAPFASAIITWFITGGNAHVASGTFVGVAIVAAGRIVWLAIKARTDPHGQR